METLHGAHTVGQSSGGGDAMRADLTHPDDDEPFRLISEPAYVWSERSVARRLCQMPSSMGYWRSREDFPKPVMTRDGKSYFDPAEIEQFCKRLGV
jgi:hypothetical protein